MRARVRISTPTQRRLQRAVDIAWSITGADLPTVEGTYRRYCLKETANIIKDPHRPGNTLTSPCHREEGTVVCKL